MTKKIYFPKGLHNCKTPLSLPHHFIAALIFHQNFTAMFLDDPNHPLTPTTGNVLAWAADVRLMAHHCIKNYCQHSVRFLRDPISDTKILCGYDGTEGNEHYLVWDNTLETLTYVRLPYTALTLEQLLGFVMAIDQQQSAPTKCDAIRYFPPGKYLPTWDKGDIVYMFYGKGSTLCRVMLQLGPMVMLTDLEHTPETTICTTVPYVSPALSVLQGQVDYKAIVDHRVKLGRERTVSREMSEADLLKSFESVWNITSKVTGLP